MNNLDKKLKIINKTIPNTPNFIHDMIVNEVQEKSDVSINNKFIFIKKWGLVAAAFLMITFLGVGVGYAAIKLSRISNKNIETISKNDNVINVGLSNEDGNIDFTEIPDVLPEVDFTFNYIPENMYVVSRSYLGFNNNTDMGINVRSLVIDDNSVSFESEEYNVVESEHLKINDKNALYIKYDSNEAFHEYGQRVYIVYPEFYRMVILNIGDKVSKEEAIKVANSLELSNSARLQYTEDLITWKQYTNNGEGNEITFEYTLDESKINFKNIGDELDSSAFNGGIKLKLNDIQILDDINSLDSKYITNEWKKYIDKNGNLMDKKVSIYENAYYKAFDDNTTIKTIRDEIMSSQADLDMAEHIGLEPKQYAWEKYSQMIREYVSNNPEVVNMGDLIRGEKYGEFSLKQKLVLLDITYYNNDYNANSNENELFISPSIFIANKYNNTYNFAPSYFDMASYNDHRYLGDVNGEYLEEVGYNRNSIPYHNFTKPENANGYNTLEMLKIGESKTIKLGFIVNECDLDSLYLNFDGMCQDGWVGNMTQVPEDVKLNIIKVID